MKKYYLQKLDKAKLEALTLRPAVNFEAVYEVVEPILSAVKKDGDKALTKYTKKFDNIEVKDFQVSQKEITEACKRVPRDVKLAFKIAAKNIRKFHKSQLTASATIETMPGVKCFRKARAIEKVGLYIPGGTAKLPSTVLMLAIPAKIAGCREVIMCTPTDSNGMVADIILFAAKFTGVSNIFKVGGAQAIAAMGYGTKTIPKVYKIFGPGNQYATAAKMLLNLDGVAIDLPAGPTEVLVIADKISRADFVAADLLSQAEHGKDSQVVLVCTDERKANEILIQVRKQLKDLPRKLIAKQVLKNSFALIVSNIQEALDFANQYAPEHLILNTEKADKYTKFIKNAGSVFLGPYSCESAGDYASGTNHTLPTSGYARSYSGVSVSSFEKQITFQQITAKGAKNIGPTVSLMAAEEELEGHKKAMELRYK